MKRASTSEHPRVSCARLVVVPAVARHFANSCPISRLRARQFQPDMLNPAARGLSSSNVRRCGRDHEDVAAWRPRSEHGTRNSPEDRAARSIGNNRSARVAATHLRPTTFSNHEARGGHEQRIEVRGFQYTDTLLREARAREAQSRWRFRASTDADWFMTAHR